MRETIGPDGRRWESRRAAARELGVSQTAIQRIAEENGALWDDGPLRLHRYPDPAHVGHRGGVRRKGTDERFGRQMLAVWCALWKAQTAGRPLPTLRALRPVCGGSSESTVKRVVDALIACGVLAPGEVINGRRAPGALRVVRCYAAEWLGD